MLEQIRSLVSRWRALQEIASLTDHDLQDLGMTRAQVEAFARMPHDVADRVAAMASIFGLNASDLKANHEEYLDLLATCGCCKDRVACSKMLKTTGPAQPSEASFCPNVPVFAEKGHIPA